MIDIENKIIDMISKELKLKVPKAKVVSTDISTEPSFPTVSVVEADNYILEPTLDSSNLQNHFVAVYQMDIYTKAVGSKKQAKDIRALIDKLMFNKGFIRISTINLSAKHNGVFRLTTRYKGVVSRKLFIYGG